MQEDTRVSASELLRDWQSRAALALYAYNRAATRCRAWDTRLGGLIAVLAAVVGTSVFATVETDVSIGARIVVGLVSVAAAVVAAVQAFATLPKRAFEYERAARAYGAVRRELEEARCFLTDDHEACSIQIAELRRKLDDAARDSPNAPTRIWNRTRREMKGEFTRIERWQRKLRGLPPPTMLGSGERNVGELHGRQ